MHRIHRLIFPAAESARYVKLELWEPSEQSDHFVVPEVAVIGEPTNR